MSKIECVRILSQSKNRIDSFSSIFFLSRRAFMFLADLGDFAILSLAGVKTRGS